MKKIIIAIIIAILGSGLIILDEIISNRIEAVKNIDRSYKEDVSELKKIEKINLWVKKQELAETFSSNSNMKDAENGMIAFYDNTPKEVGLKITKYIYKDVDLKMDMSITSKLTSVNDLYRVLSLNHNTGFVKFNNVNIKQGELTGDVTLIQPIQGDANVTQ